MEVAMARLGVSRSAVLEMAVRAFAEKCDIEVQSDEHDENTIRGHGDSGESGAASQ